MNDKEIQTGLRPMCCACGLQVGVVWFEEELSNGAHGTYCCDCHFETYRHLRIETPRATKDTARSQ